MNNNPNEEIQDLMSSGVIDSKRVAIIKISIIAFLHACMFAAVSGDIFSIWLDKKVHIDSTKIGTVLALQTLIAVLYKPVMGYLLDKFKLRINFISTIAIVGIFTGPFFQFVYQPLLTNPHTFYIGCLLGGTFLGYIVIAGSAAMFNYWDKYIRVHGGTFAIPNAFNVSGWAIMGTVLPFLYLSNPLINYYIVSGLAILLFIAFLTLKVKAFDNIETVVSSKESIKMQDIINIAKRPQFYILAIFTLLVTVILYVQGGQIGRFTLQIWSNTLDSTQDHVGHALKGAASIHHTLASTKEHALQVVQDAKVLKAKTDKAIKEIGILNVWLSPMHIVVFVISLYGSRIVQKLNPQKSLIALGCLVTIYMFACAYSGQIHSKALIVCSRRIFDITNPFVNVVVLAYVAAAFDKKINGIAYLIGFHFINNLGYSASSTFIGHEFGVIGFIQSFYDLGFIVLFGTILTAVLLYIFKPKDFKQEPIRQSKDLSSLTSEVQTS